MELLRSGLPSYYYICKLQTEYDMENRLTVGFTHEMAMVLAMS